MRAHAREACAVQVPLVPESVLRAFAEGVPATVLARDAGVAAKTLRAHARRAGVQAPARVLLPEQVNEMVDLYANGMMVQEVGRQF